jgi:ERF superfamily
MQRSSETIGTIAAALAKAQAQLINPQRSLVGTIKSNEPNGSERSFRYAPLSTGLDIVRKTLSQHEIATVQTTSIDETARIVRLSTVLAHASGEWIASDWPVCAITETAAPHRMGAALTYARRYALFTLVGIAGEDDLDAPDLLPRAAPESKTHVPTGIKKDRRKGGHGESLQHASAIQRSKAKLEAAASVALREQLVAELKNIGSAEEAANWAHRVMSAKNTLNGADSACVERVFQERLATILTDPPQGPAVHESMRRPVRPRRQGKKQRRASIDKGVLVLPSPRRLRDRDHVKSVAKYPCLICGRRPADAHHLRFVQSPALGRKVSDEFTVPLCRGHHREVHRCGDEVDWWRKTGIDPSTAARDLWLKTHPLPDIAAQSGSKLQDKPNCPESIP